MNTCSTCRWWKRDDDSGFGVQCEQGEAIEYYVQGEEIRRTAEYPVRRCQSPQLRFSEVPGRNEAAVCDGSDYWAGMFTGPDFGCMRHESLE